MNAISAVVFYLVSLAFSLFILSLWIRITLRYFKISTLTPFSQLIHTITSPIVNPFNSLIPGAEQPGNRYDWGALVVILLTEFVKICCLSLLAFHAMMPLTYLVIYIVADFIIQPCDLLFYAILIRIIMSYVNPKWDHPLNDFIKILTDPLFAMGRKIIPDISGFDFGPFVMLLILKVFTLFISSLLPVSLI